MELRPYQIKALDEIRAALLRGQNRQCVVMPTGTGKTVVMANLLGALADTELRREHPKMLVVAHRQELLDQTKEKLLTADPGLHVEIDQGARIADPNCHVLVASIQTLRHSRRHGRHDWSQFGIKVVDECHHAAAKTYTDVLEVIGPEGLSLGFTATPDRTDGQRIDHLFGEKPVYELSLFEAIEDGWLVDFKCFRIATGVSLAGVSTRRGDFAVGELEKAINTEQRNRAIVNGWLEHGEGKRTLAFTPGVASACALAQAFCSQSIEAEHVWGADPQREDKIRAFRRGEIQVLTNCELATEGYDDPGIECIIPARPTKSRPKFVQMIGRGPRPNGSDPQHPVESGTKRYCIILDVHDLFGRHDVVVPSELCGLPDTDMAGGGLLEGKRRADEEQLAGRRVVGGGTLYALRFEQFNPFAHGADADAVLKRISPNPWLQIDDNEYILPVECSRRDPGKTYNYYQRQAAAAERYMKEFRGHYQVWQAGTGWAIYYVREVKGTPRIEIKDTRFVGEETSLEEAIHRTDRNLKARMEKQLTHQQVAAVRHHLSRDHAWRKQPATDAQLNLLCHQDYTWSPHITKGRACDLITVAQYREALHGRRPVKAARPPAVSAVAV
jgi:superfamily II DNA or RNA helicase